MNETADSTTQRDVKQVIVIRRDLNMRRGKEIAQGAHASAAWLTRRLVNAGPSGPNTTDVTVYARLSEPELVWIMGSFKKVTCQVQTEDEVRELINVASFLGVEAHLITDSGLTEFNGVPTVTAAAFGPDYDDVIDQVTGKLQLY
jgi:peptidyl-tRNA hydrolase, PTH2 family